MNILCVLFREERGTNPVATKASSILSCVADTIKTIFMDASSATLYMTFIGDDAFMKGEYLNSYLNSTRRPF